MLRRVVCFSLGQLLSFTAGGNCLGSGPDLARSSSPYLSSNSLPFRPSGDFSAEAFSLHYSHGPFIMITISHSGGRPPLCHARSFLRPIEYQLGSEILSDLAHFPTEVYIGVL